MEVALKMTEVMFCTGFPHVEVDFITVCFSISIVVQVLVK